MEAKRTLSGRGVGGVGRVWCFCDGSTGALYDGRGGQTEELAHLPVRLSLSCAAAAVARGDDGDVLDLAWETLSPMTNNEAEYAGLLLGLALARRLRAQEAICVLDSEVVVRQMQGRFAVHSAALRRWHWRACEAARRIPAVHYRLAPREWNRLADGLAAQAGLSWPGLVAALDGHAATAKGGK